MTENEIISQASKNKFKVACDATDASYVELSEASVIKALECCMSENGNDCEGCSYADVTYKQGEGGCCNKLMRNSFDLINRQKAEIERLRIANTEAFSSGFEVGKITAIKEFVEKLKEKQQTKHITYKEISYDINYVKIKDIDDLVKEMTGE